MTNRAAGQFGELGPADQILRPPKEGYARKVLAAVLAFALLKACGARRGPRCRGPFGLGYNAPAEIFR